MGMDFGTYAIPLTNLVLAFSFSFLVYLYLFPVLLLVIEPPQGPVVLPEDPWLMYIQT